MFVRICQHFDLMARYIFVSSIGPQMFCISKHFIDPMHAAATGYNKHVFVTGEKYPFPLFCYRRSTLFFPSYIQIDS